MSNLRAVAQQALEAFESMLGRKPERVENVITALRAVLGEPKGGGNLPPPLSAEPVQLAYKRIGCVGHDCDECQHRALTEPVQEPVAHETLRLAGLSLIGLAEHDQHCEVFDLTDEGRHKACTCGLNDAIAVITQAGKSAPPQRKPRHVSYVCPQCQWSLDECKPMTEPLSAAIESILHTDDLSEEIHQAQVNSLRAAYDAAKSKHGGRNESA